MFRAELFNALNHVELGRSGTRHHQPGQLRPDHRSGAERPEHPVRAEVVLLSCSSHTDLRGMTTIGHAPKDPILRRIHPAEEHLPQASAQAEGSRPFEKERRRRTMGGLRREDRRAQRRSGDRAQEDRNRPRREDPDGDADRRKSTTPITGRATRPTFHTNRAKKATTTPSGRRTFYYVEEAEPFALNHLRARFHRWARTSIFLALRLLDVTLYEAQLSHLGTREGLLRRLWKLAEPSAHARGTPRVVLCRLLSGL